MIAAAFALLSCLGAWMTWRHNPLYSAKATLRFLGVTLGLLAAAAAVMAWAVKFTDGRSVGVQVAVMGGCLILCLVALILGISAVSTPAEARLQTHLPPNVALVHLYRAKIRPWLKHAAWVLGGSLLLMLIPGPVRWIGLTLAATVAFLSSFMFPVAYFTALRADRAVTALQLHPWVHWQYAPEVWRRWTDALAAQQAQAQAVNLSAPARRRTLIIVALFGAAYAAWVVPAGPWVRAGSALATGLVVLGIALLAKPASRGAATRLAQRLGAAPPQSVFGHDGVLCNGEFCAWLSTDGYLLSASLEPGPPTCIALRFEKISPAAYGAPAASQIIQRVLLPADAAPTDLPVLQAALVARCPKAEINLA